MTLPDEQRPRAVIMGSREFLEQCGLQIPAILEVTARKWEKEKDSLDSPGRLGRLGSRRSEIRSDKLIGKQKHL